MSLFSRSFHELARIDREKPEEAERVFGWLMGNWGVARDLQARNLVTVSPTALQVASMNVERRFRGETLSMFVKPLRDLDIGELPGVPNWLSGNLRHMRDFVADNGVQPVTPIVRFVDTEFHLPFSVQVASKYCGHCHNNLNLMRLFAHGSLPNELRGKGRHLIIGAPFVLPGSIGKTLKEQKDLLATVGQKLGLNFKLIHGSVSLGTLVIQSHEFITGELQPLQGKYVRTSTKFDDAQHFSLRRDAQGGLDCIWRFDDSSEDDLGCLALGVVTLG